jgi:hypothetical protein
MKNIIVVGDSFCAHPQGWPSMLADKLNLKLINYGVGGEHWWGVHEFLKTVDKNTVKYIIFAHTFGQRIPTLHKNGIDKTASELYYKHIHNEEFLNWAQEQWFKQISTEWDNVINLHCFPWTWDLRHLLVGINVGPNLASISLNEVDATEPLLDESVIGQGLRRQNHLNQFNNKILAEELAGIINNYSAGDVQLDVTKFQLKTEKWFNWR